MIKLYWCSNEFTSSTTFIPQLSSGLKTGGSSLSGLASLAGINVGNMESSSEFPPTLYPHVVDGIPFKLDLLSSEITFNNKAINVKDYFLDICYSCVGKNLFTTKLSFTCQLCKNKYLISKNLVFIVIPA